MRYIGLLFDVADPAARSLAEQLGRRIKQSHVGWSCSIDSLGLTIYHEKPSHLEQVYKLANATGVILGRLFPTEMNNWHSSWRPTLDHSESQRITQSQGASLISQYWGSYVAFLSDSVSSRKVVIRDSSGMVPCYRTKYRTVELFFCDISDIECLNVSSFDINRSYIAAYLYLSQLQIRECGIAGVHEVLAGECVDIDGGAVHQYAAWNPSHVYRKHRHDNYSSAVNAVRETTQKCIDAWASIHDHILLQLSGGLDSSVVLACLARSPFRPDITCITRYSSRAAEDERVYARLSASRANAKLIEHPWQGHDTLLDDRFFNIPRTPKPTIATVFLSSDEIDFRNEVVNLVKSDSVWDGQGGDHIFFSTRSTLSACDYVSLHGWRLEALHAILDAAKFSEQSFWSVLLQAGRSVDSQGDWRSETTDAGGRSYFVNHDALPSDLRTFTSNPWSESVQTLVRGKKFQILSIAEVLNRHRPDCRLLPAREHHPLFSQPLVEQCIQVPTYHLLKGGRNRSLARHAFQDCVPSEIISRTSKGTTTNTIVDTLRNNDHFIRDLLLDGILVKERILLRAKLEPFLVGKRPFGVEHLFPICASIAAEVWARSVSKSYKAGTSQNGQIQLSAN